MSKKNTQLIRIRLGLTVSALALASVGAAHAQTYQTTTGFQTVTINTAFAAQYQTFEVTNGTKAVIVPSWAQATWAVGNNTAVTLSSPGGSANISTLKPCQNSGLAYSSTSCLGGAPTIQVDKGGTLVLGGAQTNASIVGGYGFESAVHADGDVVIEYAGPPQSWGTPTQQFVGTNSFLGNITMAQNATATFGFSWAAAPTVFGPGTNIILGNNSVLDIWLPGAGTATMGGSVQGTGTLNVDSGTLIINGANTTAVPFAGTLSVKPGATLMVGDSSHATAVLGNPGTPSAYTLTLAGTPSGGSTLRGFGTIAGNLVNTSSTVQPGDGTNTGTLTVLGNYSQNSVGTLKVMVTPNGASTFHVVGNAAMNGSLSIGITPGAYKTQIYNIVQVDGTLSGDFTSIAADSVQGAIAAVTKTAHGYSVVTEVVQGANATSPIVVGHLGDANRLNNYYFVGALYDQIALDTPRGSAEIGKNKYAWVEGFGHVSSISRNDVGYHTDTEGVRAGLEYRNESNATLGLAMSYSTENLKAKGASTASIDTWHVAAYGGYDVQYLRLDGVLFYDTFNTTTKRDFGTDGVAASSPGGYSYGASVQGSRTVMNGLLTPFIRGIYSRQHVDASVETGAPLLNLRYLASNHNTFVGDIGFRVNPLRAMPESKTKLLVTVALEHDFSPLGERVDGSFPVDNGQSWFSYWRGDSENTLIGSLDVARQITDRLEVSGRVTGRMSLFQTSGELALNARYHF